MAKQSEPQKYSTEEVSQQYYAFLKECIPKETEQYENAVKRVFDLEYKYLGIPPEENTTRDSSVTYARQQIVEPATRDEPNNLSDEPNKEVLKRLAGDALTAQQAAELKEAYTALQESEETVSTHENLHAFHKTRYAQSYMGEQMPKALESARKANPKAIASYEREYEPDGAKAMARANSAYSLSLNSGGAAYLIASNARNKVNTEMRQVEYGLRTQFETEFTALVAATREKTAMTPQGQAALEKEAQSLREKLVASMEKQHFPEGQIRVILRNLQNGLALENAERMEVPLADRSFEEIKKRQQEKTSEHSHAPLQAPADAQMQAALKSAQDKEYTPSGFARTIPRSIKSTPDSLPDLG